MIHSPYQRNSSEDTCYTCKTIGHLTHNCPKTNPSPVKNQASSSTPQMLFGSDGETEPRILCKCGTSAKPQMVVKSEKNLGKWYFKCMGNCGFVKWMLEVKPEKIIRVPKCKCMAEFCRLSVENSGPNAGRTSFICPIKKTPRKAGNKASNNTGDLGNTIPRPVVPFDGFISRPVSPFARRPSPPRSATPLPTTSGVSFTKSAAESLKKTNELLNKEVLKLRREVESLRRKCDQKVLKLRREVESLRRKCEVQEVELQKSTKKTQEAMTLAEEESSKSKAAKEVINSLTAQPKDIAERFPPGVCEIDGLRQANLPNWLKPNGNHYHPITNEDLTHSRSDSVNDSYFSSRPITDTTSVNGTNGPTEQISARTSDANGGQVGPKESSVSQDTENRTNPRNLGDQAYTEWIEQYEPGVYITLVVLQDGIRDLKRVRFSRRRFGEHQAETWWSENRDKVYEKYNVRGSDRSPISQR